jgi:hypothetical protein
LGKQKLVHSVGIIRLSNLLKLLHKFQGKNWKQRGEDLDINILDLHFLEEQGRFFEIMCICGKSRREGSVYCEDCESLRMRKIEL